MNDEEQQYSSGHATGLHFMNGRAYGVITAGFFTVGIAFSIRYGYGLLLPEMVPALGISKTQAGIIFASYFLVYTLATPLLGALTDRINYRLILSLFTLFLACGALLMAFATSLLTACLFFGLAGFGHAACWAPVSALVQKWVPDQKRGMALSFVSMGLGVGIPLWSLGLPVIVKIADWRAGWLSMGFVALAVAVLNYILVRNPIPKNRDGDLLPLEPLGTLWQSYRTLLVNRTFWLIGMGYFFVGINVVIPFTFVPIYAREVFNLPYSQATRFVALMAFSGIVGQMTLGVLSDSFGRVRVMILCGLIMATACLGMALSNSPWMLYGFSIWFGFGYGAVWPAYGAAASDFFPKGHTGVIVGLWTSLLGIGSVISPVVCGWTIDATGSYTWSLLLGLFSGVMSATVLLAMTDTVPRISWK